VLPEQGNTGPTQKAHGPTCLQCGDSTSVGVGEDLVGLTLEWEITDNSRHKARRTHWQSDGAEFTFWIHLLPAV